MNRPLPQTALSKIRLWGLIIVASVVCISCAPFSRDIMKQVDESIAVNDVQKNLEQFKGKKVLWGGVIIETENRSNETRILIMKTALDIEKRPVNRDLSEGRFILKQNDFLDPVIYAQGREITVVGEVVGKENLPLGKIRYDYPVVMAEHCVLWEKPGYYYPISYPYHYYYGPYWDYNPLWSHYPLRGYYRMYR